MALQLGQTPLVATNAVKSAVAVAASRCGCNQQTICAIFDAIDGVAPSVLLCPVPEVAPPVTPCSSSTSTATDKPCRRFARFGRCKFGSACYFSHDIPQCSQSDQESNDSLPYDDCPPIMKTISDTGIGDSFSITEKFTICSDAGSVSEFIEGPTSYELLGLDTAVGEVAKNDDSAIALCVDEDIDSTGIHISAAPLDSGVPASGVSEPKENENQLEECSVSEPIEVPTSYELPGSDTIVGEVAKDDDSAIASGVDEDIDSSIHISAAALDSGDPASGVSEPTENENRLEECLQTATADC